MTVFEFGNHGLQFPDGNMLHHFVARVEERLADFDRHGYGLASLDAFPAADAAPHDLPDLAPFQLHLNFADDLLPAHFPADNLFT